MCGIAGYLRFDDEPAARAGLEAMTGAMHHRGPDGAGYHVQGRFGLAMTRLAIIDVAGGQQPIFNEDETLAIVCNGEIYNYTALRTELERRGHAFRTHSDVEVILHLYEDEGDRCFARLNGMFGAAIADFRRQRLVLARDHFSQKPLYIWRKQNVLAFASELKALARLPGFRRDVSPEALAGFLAFRYVPAPLTIFRETEKLPPGSYMTVDARGACEVRRYWQADLSSKTRNSTDPEGKQTRQYLMDAVERHLMSERPLGVFLSGGLDSSAIVACMHLSGHRDIHTYTVGFEGFEDNEFGTARSVAEKFKTSHQEVTLTADEFWESLDCTTFSADEPLADLTTIPLYHLARYAARDVVVVLSGEGSDELMAGYGGMEEHRRFFDLLRSLRFARPIAGPLARLALPDAVRRRLLALAGSHADYLARNPYNITNVFDEDFRRRHSLNGTNGNALNALSGYYRSRQAWHGVNLYLGALIEWWLPDDLLHKADRMTMAHSIELRCPFLDAEFARYCANLGLDDKVLPEGGEAGRKVALKKAFAGVLPEGIAYQRKKGFTVPVYDWLGTGFAERARAELTREDSLAASVFGRDVRDGIMRRAAAGEKRSQHQAWALIVLNKWGQRWL